MPIPSLWSYIDPMAGSLFLQSVLAMILGVGVFLRGAVYRSLARLFIWKPNQAKVGSRV